LGKRWFNRLVHKRSPAKEKSLGGGKEASTGVAAPQKDLKSNTIEKGKRENEEKTRALEKITGLPKQ